VAARHSPPRSGSSSLRATLVSVLVAAAVIAVAAAGIAWSRAGGATADGTATQRSPGSSQSSGAPGSPHSATPTPSPPPLHLLAVTPAAATPVPGTTPIVVTFDAAVTTDVLPTITPSTDGTWSHPTPTTLRFDPTVAFVPDTHVTVTIPSSMHAADGAHLTAGATHAITIGDGSLARLQQLLADLHYLPLTFTPDPTDAAAASAAFAATQSVLAFDPPSGQFAFRFDSTPPALAALWQPGAPNVLTRGAIMAFESAHRLAVDGIAGHDVWTALLADATSGTLDPRPYSWVWTTTGTPETLRVWSDGSIVFSSAANTGIPAAPTPKGSWPVFARYRSQEMKGTNPDGTKYDDPGVPYVNYFHAGDAVHGFQRSSYGTAQSLGCIELPYAAAAQVWNLIDYGTVVTVTS
jgi:peptidoglycan hydrolase-like protein with peptidoglycan-binding domain